MNRISKALFAALALAPLSALALPPDCDARCVSPIPCRIVCAIPWTMQVVSCGVWVEDYDPGASCVPDTAAQAGEEEQMFSSEDADEVDAAWECSEQGAAEQ
ncbi:hypothetical protein OWM54_37090 [Myxococcus sp. MISCRS1]|uniref:hypothetical protein n=1 Tax=Myxococcus TaxID=32 RepID=UPI0022721255|nr:hypothetical protein [Myxococcus sp. MISCRS1]MCY1002781.1 hypothetical protein [Myxococcus sp. MISCRS1]BDT35648.1 hypothetical protein MFMH1_53170 [Myxococcus sp. MH1]